MKMDDKIIVNVNDKSLGLNDLKVNDECKVRYGSRGIVIEQNGDIAIFNKRSKNEYKLPGGGIEEGENPMEAFMREIMEETGCEIEIIDYLGLAVEEKGQTNFKQISYVFVAKVLNNTKGLHLTEKEKDEDAVVMWVSLREALELVNGCIDNLVGSKYDDLYRSLFMVKRDSEILNYYKEIYLKENKESLKQGIK